MGEIEVPPPNLMNDDNLRRFMAVENAIYLTPSDAHRLIEKSALHAYTFKRQLGGVKNDSTEATQRGKILEILITGHGMENLVLIDAKDYKSASAKAQRDAANEQRKTPLLAHKLEEFQYVALRIRQNIAAKGISWEGGTFQQELKWTSNGVKCKCTPDWFSYKYGLVRDIKCVADARPDKARSHFTEYGYCSQSEATIEAVGDQYPELAGRVKSEYIFCEVDEPYTVQVYEPSGTMRELGRSKWERAKKVWRECMESGQWPGYSTGSLAIEAASWQMDREHQATIQGGE